jgi:cysteinyl-tRNA synthetase
MESFVAGGLADQDVVQGKPLIHREARDGDGSALDGFHDAGGEDHGVAGDDLDFFTKALSDLGVAPANLREPFTRLFTQGMIRLDGDKMSKSLGNISRVSDLLAGGAEPRALRLALISAHYRTSLNYNDDSLTAAASAISRIDAFVAALSTRSAIAVGDADVDQRAVTLAETSWSRFAAAMDDDLAVPEALAALFDLVRDGNRLLDANCSGAGAQALIAVLEKINAVLAVLPDRAVLPAGAEALLAERIAARAAKDWARSDALRDELAGLGVLIDDGRDGQRWRLAGPQA